MSTTTFLTKNVNAFPLCLAILSGGLLSYKLLEKQFYIKIVVAVLVFYFGYTFYPKYASELSFQKSKVDYPLIENTTLQKQDSSFLNLSNLNDKIIVLEFWNSACGQCIKEFPRFNEFYNKYKNQYNIYSVNIPLNRDKKTHFSPKKLIDSLGYNFPILSMDADSAKKLGIKYYPTAIVIDKNERVKFKGRLTYGAKGRYNFENILKKIKNE